MVSKERFSLMMMTICLMGIFCAEQLNANNITANNLRKSRLLKVVRVTQNNGRVHYRMISYVGDSQGATVAENLALPNASKDNAPHTRVGRCIPSRSLSTHNH